MQSTYRGRTQYQQLLCNLMQSGAVALQQMLQIVLHTMLHFCSD